MCSLSLRFTTCINEPYRMQYTQSLEQCHTEGNMFKVSFWVWQLYVRGGPVLAGGPNISKSNGPGGPIISGDLSLRDMTCAHLYFVCHSIDYKYIAHLPLPIKISEFGYAPLLQYF